MRRDYRRGVGTLVLGALLASGCSQAFRGGRDDVDTGDEDGGSARADGTRMTTMDRTAGTTASADETTSADGNPNRGATASEPPAAMNPALAGCGVDAAEAAHLEALAEALDESVHELIKCGQLQAGLAGNLLAILLASNESLFESSTEHQILITAAEVLGLMTDVPLSQREDGTWEMQVGATGGSHFEIVFFDPEGGDAIVVDPFVIDSYLLGARVDSSDSLLEMLLYPNRRSTFTVRFEGEGPLAHVLADGAPIPNPFEVRLSMADLLDLAEGEAAAPEDGGPDFGPLASLSRLDMSSGVRLRDERGEVTVRYDAAGMRDQLRVIARSGVGFELDALVAENPELRLRAQPSALHFVPGVGLAGEVELQLESGTVQLRSDYADGTDVPSRSWACDGAP